jgi:predicted AAA+ superfamily ATPase
MKYMLVLSEIERLILSQKKEDRVVYIQSSYILTDEQAIQREYSPLESVEDNYEKFVVSLDDIAFPSNKGIRHIQAWNFSNIIQ